MTKGRQPLPETQEAGAEKNVQVLLVEQGAEDVQHMLGAFSGPGGECFRVKTASRLAVALQHLNKVNVDVILLDLNLPDASGLTVFAQVHAAAPETLIVVLATPDDEQLASQMVLQGADDYLIKRHVDKHWLPRTLNYLLERKAARLALKLSEARFRAMSDASPLGIFVSNAAGNCNYSNAAYQRLSGLSMAQALDSNWLTAIHPDDLLRVEQAWRDTPPGDSAFQTDARFLRPDGSIVWTRLNAARMHDGARLCGHVRTIEDISAHREASDALFAEKERAQVTLNSIGDAVISTNLPGMVTFINQVAEKMTGWMHDSAIGQPLETVFRIINGSTREPAVNPALRAIREKRTVALAANSILLRVDGQETAIEDSAAPIHDRDGVVTGAVIVFHDVTASRAITQQMAHLAQHDFLTGLPNRSLLTERLSRAIGQARRHEKMVALLYIDLDSFKQVNDLQGHATGDQLLQAVAERLAVCVRDTDTVCRQGGDEFVILLTEVDHPEDAGPIAQKLLDAFAVPCKVGNRELHITLSIGISIYPDDGTNPDLLLDNADSAMYRAKANGRNNFQFFSNVRQHTDATSRAD